MSILYSLFSNEEWNFLMISWFDSFSKSRTTGNYLSLIVRSDNSIYFNFLNFDLSIELFLYFYSTDKLATDC